MEYIIRPVSPEDAEKLVEYMRKLTSEPDLNIPWSPGEFTMTAQEERDFITSFISDERSLWIVAAHGDEIVASSEIRTYKRSGLKHMATLGIGIAKAHRGNRIGDRMMSHLVEWAKNEGGIKRIELWVFARNLPAIKLYLKHGFKIEGKRTAGVFKNGEYLDDYLMGLILD